METNERLESVKRRIKKLLALSKSPNENEAMAALEKARDLLKAYGLGEGVCQYGTYPVKATKRFSVWRAILANAVAPLYYCAIYRSEAKGNIYFYGDRFDAFMAGEMYRYLVKTIDSMARRDVRPGALRKYRDSFRLGAACRLKDRLEAAGKAASWGPDRETKLLAVRKALEKELVLTPVQGKAIKVSDRAFRLGAQAGDGISLNRQTTGSGDRRIGDGGV